MADRGQLDLSRRKVRDRSVALLILGILLLLPPIAAVSLLDRNIGGIPIPVLYVFVVWICLIVGGAILAYPLRDGDETSEQPEQPENPEPKV